MDRKQVKDMSPGGQIENFKKRYRFFRVSLVGIISIDFIFWALGFQHVWSVLFMTSFFLLAASMWFSFVADSTIFGISRWIGRFAHLQNDDDVSRKFDLRARRLHQLDIEHARLLNCRTAKLAADESLDKLIQYAQREFEIAHDDFWEAVRFYKEAGFPSHLFHKQYKEYILPDTELVSSG